MLKPIMIKLLTLPWVIIAVSLMWAVENRAEVITEPWQVFLMMAAVTICLLTIWTGFAIANEVKQEEEQLRKMNKKKSAPDSRPREHSLKNIYIITNPLEIDKSPDDSGAL